MNKLWYSWEEMRRDVNVLARDIVLNKFDPKVIVGLSKNPNDNGKVEDEVRKEVVSLCSSFPMYKNLRK